MQSADLWGIESSILKTLDQYAYRPTFLAEQAALIATYAFGLVYVLRLAKQFHSRALEIASAVLLSAGIIIPAEWIAFAVIATARDFFFGFGHMAREVNYDVTFYGGTILWTCLLVYFTILAVKLHRAAWRPPR